MLRKIVWLFIVLPAGAVLVAFALANWQTARLSFDPFSTQDPFLAFDAPLFLILLAAFLAGLLAGGGITWLGQGKWRRTVRRQAREMNTLRARQDRHEAELRKLSKTPPDNAEAAE